MNKNSTSVSFSTTKEPSRKRVVLYARVSSEEQTKGKYPSCATQIEDTTKYAQERGWQIVEAIKDEGFSAGSLKRPGMTKLRWLIENREMDAVICTWYDRFSRKSGDFYLVDKELRDNCVGLITLYDVADRDTAAGRLTEAVLVAAKSYDREQTSEKVVAKMRQRAMKGMWNGGKIPFGFKQVDAERTIEPDPDYITILNEMFRVYNETGSDFKVRDWLQMNGIKNTKGGSLWQVSSLKKILTNRRYIAQIEINREKKGLVGVPEQETYRVAAAPYKPIVPLEVFEIAQRLREQRSLENPTRVGRPRSYSQSQCGRVYPLQGILVCEECGSAMTPYYIKHSAGEDKHGKKRKNDSFIHYYQCASQVKHGSRCRHSNRVSAPKAEAWVMNFLNTFVVSEGLIEEVVENAIALRERDFEPLFEAVRLNGSSLRQVNDDIEKLLNSLQNGELMGALLKMANERAFRLEYERNQLMVEKRRLEAQLAPMKLNVEAGQIRAIIADFCSLVKQSPPEEFQQLLKLLVHRIEWKAKPKVSSENQLAEPDVEREPDEETVELYLLEGKKLKPTHAERERAVVRNYGVLRYPVGDSNP
jgi:site-specific DNA recombinase